jgi:hypothetical protein
MLSELVAAIVMLCHFHALSSFVMGCGVINEPPAAESPEVNNVVADNKTETDERVPEIMKEMEDLMSHKEDLELAELARR